MSSMTWYTTRSVWVRKLPRPGNLGAQTLLADGYLKWRSACCIPVLGIRMTSIGVAQRCPDAVCESYQMAAMQQNRPHSSSLVAAGADQQWGVQVWL